MRNAWSVVVLVVVVVAGCGTKKNPDACCVDEADCASIGLPAGSACEDGRSCRNNRCVELPCASSSDCDALEPYCGGDICEPICSEDGQCPGFGQSAAQQFCEGSCVECRVATDCGASTPVCDAGACRKCVLNEECASGVCTADGSCAGELAIAYAAPAGSPASACTRAEPCSFTRALDPGINRRYVVLASGNYSLPGPVVLAGLRSFIASAGSKPVLTSSNPGPILRLGSGADITFDGLELRGARDTTATSLDGAGIECPSNFQKSTAKISRCAFTQNQTAGVQARQCNVAIRESTFTANLRGFEATDVAGSIERSTFALNTETALGLDGGLYSITNNFIVRNARGVELYLPIPGTTFEFNTVADNATVGVACGGLAEHTFPANLVSGNGTNVSATIECNFVSSMIIDGDSSSVKYKSPTNPPYDYHLTTGSIAVDQITVSTQAQDFDGEVRPHGNGHDFGADELH